MIRYVFLLIFISLSILLGVGFFIVFNNNKSKHCKSISSLFLIASIMYFFYSIRLFTDNKMVFLIFHTLTYLSKYAWMLAFFKFMIEYFEIKISVYLKVGIIFLFFLDVTLCTVNLFTSFMGVTLAKLYRGEFIFLFKPHTLVVIYHLLPYTLFLEGLYLLIRQRLRSSEIFKFKYNTLITVISVLLFSNLGYILIGKLPINYAIIGFGIVTLLSTIVKRS